MYASKIRSTAGSDHHVPSPSSACRTYRRKVGGYSSSQVFVTCVSVNRGYLTHLPRTFGGSKVCVYLSQRRDHTNRICNKYQFDMYVCIYVDSYTEMRRRLWLRATDSIQRYRQIGRYKPCTRSNVCTYPWKQIHSWDSEVFADGFDVAFFGEYT